MSQDYRQLLEAQRNPANPFVSGGIADADRSTTHDPYPLLSAVREVAGAWGPLEIGPTYQAADGVFGLGNHPRDEAGPAPRVAASHSRPCPRSRR